MAAQLRQKPKKGSLCFLVVNAQRLFLGRLISMPRLATVLSTGIDFENGIRTGMQSLMCLLMGPWKRKKVFFFFFNTAVEYS